MFKFYLRASLLLTALVLLALMTQMHEDASGSRGHGFEYFFAWVGFGLAFVHSGIMSLIYAAKRSDAQGRWALMAHGAFLLMPLLQGAVDEGLGRYREMQREASPAYKMEVAIESGTVGQFNGEWARATTGKLAFTPEGNAAAEEDWAMKAIQYGRLDILQSLKDLDHLGLGAQAQTRYEELVIAAAGCADGRCGSDRLAVVQWLVEQGKGYGLTLQPASPRLFEPYTFAQRYDFSNPGTAKMLEIFLAEGANLNSDDHGELLREAVRANKIENVKFLLAHGYALGKLKGQEGDGRSVLGDALRVHSPQMTALLLAAGMTPRHARDEDDLSIACTKPYDDEEKAQAQLVLVVLHHHGVHMSAGEYESAARNGDSGSLDLECLRKFVQ